MTENNSNQRILPTQFLQSTKKSRAGVYIFIAGVLMVLLGVSFKIWPITEVTITPSVLFYEDEVSVNISLDLFDPSPATMTIPGRLLTIGEDVNYLIQQGYLVKKIEGTAIVFLEQDLQNMVVESAKRILSDSITVLYDNIDISDGYWNSTESKTLYQGKMEVAVAYYYDFPIDKWRQELVGLKKSEALQILQSKPGVGKVRIEFYPIIMANISQIISSRGQAVRFTLDTDSKTSILE